MLSVRGAFSSSELTKIYIPENVETIGAYAFASCNNLKEVSVPLQLCKEDVPGNAIQSTFSSLNGGLDVETVIVRNDKGEKMLNSAVIVWMASTN